MNKETIYIEPNDDITKILSKIKSSDKKIVALVPPKRSNVLLSSVNIKLISRAARSSEKNVVLVTTDDSLTKLAMSAKIPVASSLKSRPILPGHEEPTKEKPEESLVSKINNVDPADFLDEPEISKLVEEDDEEEIIEEETEDEKEEPESKKQNKNNKKEDNEDDEKDEDEEEDDDEEDDEDEEKDNKKEKSSKSSKKKEKKKSKTGSESWFSEHKVWIISGSAFVVLMTAFLIWAFVFAPSVKLDIKVRTTSENFAENITVTKDSKNENTQSGIFYAHEEKKENEQTIKFTATGQKDMGEPASGSLVVYYQSPNSFSFNIASGSTFTYNGLEYVSLAPVTIQWDGKKTNVCDNKDDYEADVGCQMSATVSVKSSSPGEKYNVSGRQSGWASKEYPSLSVYNSSDISGGTSKIVTIVQESDVNLALDKLKSEHQNSEKDELLKNLPESVLPITASFKIDATDPVATPGVGQEVPEGTTPSVSSKTTYSILTLERAQIEQFIKDKAKIDDNQKLYSYGSPFVEYFSQNDESNYSGKLKTTYKYGPKISETEVLDKISGQKIGRIEPELKTNFPGIASVSIEKSHFWVSSVPKDPNHIKIELEVEE